MVVAFDADEESRTMAHADGYDVVTSLPELVANVTHVVLAVPTPSVSSTVTAIAKLVNAASEVPLLVSDVASVKGEMLGTVSKIVESTAGLEYLSLHPMAGREGSGYSSADAEIFGARTWVAAVWGSISAESLARASELVASCGDTLLVVDASVHDEVVALVSHLPHVVSFVYASLVTESPLWSIAQRVGAGSFADMVRVAQSNPSRVREMIEPNKDHLTPLLEELRARLRDAESALRLGEEDDGLYESFLPSSLSAQLAKRTSALVDREVTFDRRKLVSGLLQEGMEGFSLVTLLALPGGESYRAVLRGGLR
jgi:prephenate dehydrogenase